MFAKNILKRVLLRQYYSSDTYIRYLRKLGCRIGEGTTIFSPKKTNIDITRPWLITIGNDVQLTEGVTILTHGYDWSVLKGVYGEVLGSSGAVSIGNNVFIGIHTTILKGVHIGNNVIIGANSLVNKNIPDNCVAAGNPCKKVMSLQEYYEKRKVAQATEARELVRLYKERYGKDPDEKALREYFWLFCDDPDQLPEEWKSVNRLVSNEAFTNAVMKKHEKVYDDKEAFLREAYR